MKNNTYEFNMDYKFNGREVYTNVEVVVGNISFNYYQPDDPSEVSILSAYYKDTRIDLTDKEMEELWEDDQFYTKAVEIASDIKYEGDVWKLYFCYF